MSKIQRALGRIQGSGKAPQFGRQRAAKSGDDVAAEGAEVSGTERSGNGHDREVQLSNRTIVIDWDKLREQELIAPTEHEQVLENQYRDIKRPVIAHAFGKRATKIDGGNLIMVTSSLSGEGKTFSSLNLAISMARERDYSVLLVDADVAKPHTSKVFGVQDEPGLLDILEGTDRPLFSHIIATDIPNLRVLPAGAPRPGATELLASYAMRDTIRKLTENTPNQLVVFDSPPILQTSEAKVLSDLVGQILVVVKADDTPKDAAIGAIGMLDQSKAINLILNQARSATTNYKFGYAYGYGYGFNSEVGESDEEQNKSETQ